MPSHKPLGRRPVTRAPLEKHVSNRLVNTGDAGFAESKCDLWGTRDGDANRLDTWVDQVLVDMFDVE